MQTSVEQRDMPPTVLMLFGVGVLHLVKVCTQVGGDRRGLWAPGAAQDVEYFIDHRWGEGVKVADGVTRCCGGGKVLNINHVWKS